ncbi:MAG: hypothetical protein PHW27_00075 [Melioribacteraceae bacterium]|nr:hypothetical protein [Melioribacteraceae bacterium]
MAERSSKIATGCGIGCGVVAIIIIVVGVLVYNYVKDTVQNVEQIEEISKTLTEKFGREEDFVPVFEQPKFEERLNLFLNLRDTLNIRSTKFYENFSELVDTISGEKKDKNFWESIGLINTGISVVPEMIKYYSNRNTLLLDYGMSLGEYYFYYIVSYFSYLKKSPGDGPPIKIFEDDHAQQDGVNLDLEVKDEKAEDVIAMRNFDLAQKVNYLFKNFLNNYIQSSADSEFSQLVKSEYEILNQDRTRIPWEEGLPETLVSIMEEVKEKIESTYVAVINPIELNSIKQKLHK